MPRMENTVIGLHYRKLPPGIYTKSINPLEQKETIRVEKVQEALSTGTIRCRMCYGITSEKICCHRCNATISLGKVQETSSSKTSMQSIQEYAWKMQQGSTYPDTGSLSRIISPISTWEVTRGKRALLCGVTYNNTKFKLRGAVNDINSMVELLNVHFQFPRSSIHILAETMAHHHPTKSNIQAAMRWLVKDCQAGDSLFFYFTGHGLRQPDFEDDELDGFDETLCPMDFTTEGMILDNEINQTIVRPLKKGVILHAIIDACHNGTSLDLSHVYSIKDYRWIDNFPPSGAYKGTSGGLAISLIPCENDQLAADTSAFSLSRKQMQGAVTYAFVKAVKENPRVTYSGLLASMFNPITEARNEQRFSFSLRQVCIQAFKRQKQQEILLSSSEPFNVNKEFML